MHVYIVQIHEGPALHSFCIRVRRRGAIFTYSLNITFVTWRKFLLTQEANYTLCMIHHASNEPRTQHQRKVGGGGGGALRIIRRSRPFLFQLVEKKKTTSAGSIENKSYDKAAYTTSDPHDVYHSRETTCCNTFCVAPPPGRGGD